jgi:hypothetical protein
VRARERGLWDWADSDETASVHREESEGEGEDCGLTVIRLYIIGKSVRGRGRTGG